jgi:hypothetical protein
VKTQRVRREQALEEVRGKGRCNFISHGKEGFGDDHLASMEGAGLIHLGGHASPDRVDDGVTGTQARRLKLSPCVVFSGACYTGVTGRWFDQWHSDRVTEGHAAPADSFCLNLLQNQAVAYLGVVHPDHGVRVEVRAVTAGGERLRYRLVGSALERDGSARLGIGHIGPWA